MHVSAFVRTETRGRKDAAIGQPQLKSRSYRIFLAFCLSLCLALVSWFGLLGDLEVSIGAQPVMVELRGIPESARDRVTVTYQTPPQDPEGDQQQFGHVIPSEYVAFPDASRSQWTMTGHWIKTIHITAPGELIDRLESVTMRIGDRTEIFHQSELARWTRINKPFTGLLPDRSQAAITIESPAPPDNALPAINAGTMASFIQRLLSFPFVALAVALAWAWALIHFARSASGVATWQRISEAQAHIADQKSSWFWAGAALCAVGLGSLYARYSYPFTQDDNFSQFLPVVTYACRSVFEGNWPAWNPHQFMGAPLATIGIYGVTYPPLYLAYGLARLLGQENWTIEIYTLLHLAAGYVLVARLVRRMGARAPIAALAASSFVLSGWFLTAGRSQMTFAPLAVWPVAMAWSLHELGANSRPGWRFTAWTAVVIGLFFHAGHAQMWVYGLMMYCFGIGLYWLAGRLDWCGVLRAVPAVLIGIGLATPLLILQAIEGTSSARAGAYGDRIDLLHMLLPLGRLLPRPIALGSYGSEYFAELYYSGTLFQTLSMGALLLALARFLLFRWDAATARRWLGEHVWLVLFGIAIVFGLGSHGLLWTALGQLPVFGRFRWPIKFEYYCLLFSTLGGAVLAERLLEWRPRLQSWIVAATAVLLLFHVSLCRASWYDFADRPYPALRPFMAPVIHQPEGRVLTRWQSMDRSPRPGFYQTLALDFATEAGAYSVGGYDTFVEGAMPWRVARQRFWRDPVAAARAYGVKWVVIDREFDDPVHSTNPIFRSLEGPRVANLLALHAAQDAGRKIGGEGHLTLYELSDSDPLAFSENRKALPVRMNSNGAMVNTPSASKTEITINVSMRPWMRAVAADGKRLPVEADEWGRVRVRVAESTASVAVLYSAPWSWTLLCGGFLVLVGVAGHWRLQRALLALPGKD